MKQFSNTRKDLIRHREQSSILQTHVHPPSVPPAVRHTRPGSRDEASVSPPEGIAQLTVFKKQTSGPIIVVLWV